MDFPPRLSLARRPTPFYLLERLSATLGGPRIWIKRDDLTEAAAGGNKIRKLEYVLARARAAGCDALVTSGGIQSNHCRATALACARLGLECHLILRGQQEGAPDGNLLLDHLAGATFSFYPREVYSTRKPEIVAELIEHYARQGKKAYWIPVGASNAIGSWGYIRAYQEMMHQVEKSNWPNRRIDHIVTAVGSGGTLAGLIAGRALFGGKNAPRIWGVNVCDDAEYFKTEVRGILEELNEKFNLGLTERATPIEIFDGYVGEGYAIPYPEEIEAIKQAAREEGQILDPVYTGKAFYGLTQEILKGRFKTTDNVVFLHTGGMFGLFPQREQFGFGESD